MKKLFNGLETDYLDGFQYKFTHACEAPSGTMTNDEMKLRIIPTSEGYYDALRNAYFYNYTDHLGNVRVSYSDRDGNNEVTGDIVVNNCYNTPDGMVCNNYIITGEAEGVTNYYPFGMMHNSEYNTFDNAYQNKYNGKELQETGMYDYGARFYMPDVGRWGVVDPLAESSRRFTPYHYGNNNPVRFIDPDGRLTMDNLGTYSPGSAVADFINKNGFGDDYLPMFYRDEAGMMIVNQSLGNDGQGGGGTMGGLMDAVGIAMDGGIGSYEQAIGGLSLWQQVVDGGWNDPLSTKAKYGDKNALLEKVSALSELFKITGANFEEDSSNKNPAETVKQNIYINMSKISNILLYAFILGHEMNHVFDNRFFKDKFIEITRIGREDSIPFRNAFFLFKESTGLGWEMKMGNSILCGFNGFEAASYYYGPNGAGRYDQNTINKLAPFMNELMRERNIKYNKLKNK